MYNGKHNITALCCARSADMLTAPACHDDSSEYLRMKSMDRRTEEEIEQVLKTRYEDQVKNTISMW